MEVLKYNFAKSFIGSAGCRAADAITRADSRNVDAFCVVHGNA